MPETPFPPNETARLAALQRYQILNTPPEAAFDDLARLAAFCCQTPMAAISFVSQHQVWLKATVGPLTPTIPRAQTVCTHTILGDQLCIINNLLLDPRLVDSILVTEHPGLRFYAGVPLLTPEGYAIGTLCVMDVVPRTISSEQQTALQGLARQVTTQLELRRHIREVQSEITKRERAQQELHKSQQALALFVQQTLFAVISLDTSFLITDWNPAAEKIFGYSRAEMLGRHPVGLITAEKYGAGLDKIRHRVLVDKQSLSGHNENLHRDGRTLICEWYLTPLVSPSGEILGITAIAQEVTDTVRANEALQASEARFRALFEASPVGICIVRGTTVLYANPAAIMMVGATAEQWTNGISILNFIAPEHRALQVERLAKRSRNEAVPSVYEISGQRLDGSCFPIQIQTGQVILGDGPAIIAFISDITESRRAKEEVEQSLALLRATLDSTADGILVVDSARQIASFNQKFVEMWQLPASVMAAGKDDTALDFVLKQLVDPASFLAKVHELYEQPDATSFDEFTFKDGRIFERYSQPVQLEGKSAGRVWSFRDVSKRRRAEEALRQSEALLRGVIDNTVLTIFVKALDGRYLLVNRNWERRNGYTLEQVRGKTNYDIFDSALADRYHDWDQQIIASGKVSEFEDHSLEADGRHLFSCIRALLYDQAGQPYAIIGISTDITERRHLEEQLQQAQKMEAIGRLAGGVAHDFNNILTTIYSACTLAHRRLAEDSPVHRYLNEIQKAGERAAALIQQLLAFSRKQVVQTTILSLPNLLLDMEDLLRRLVGENIQVTFQLAPDLDAVQADLSQMEQVLLNLVANARDAMPNGGRLTISADNVWHTPSNASKGQPGLKRPYVRLTVIDSGHGVDPATLPYIFEPFFTTKAPGKGTGLGLATVYGIVQQNGGEIQVESQLAQGTTVRILLPSVDALPTNSKGVLNSAPPAPGPETLLVVEDQESVRQTIVEMLAEHGYQVLAAASASEAVKLHATYPGVIDLLLTDVVMPVTSGSELATSLRHLQPSLRVLYMSGHTEDEAVMVGVRNEQAAFLQKPFTQTELLQQLRTVLDR